MIDSIFTAVYQLFFPMLVLSALLSFWYLKKHQPDSHSTSTKALRKTIEAHSKKLQSDQSNDAMSYAFGSLPNKWLAFGGNFYGLMAFYTYLIFEYQQIERFVAQYSSISELIDQLSFKLLINQMIEALVNLGFSLGWPYRWMKQVNEPVLQLIWLVLAYIGFLLGMKAALYFHQKQQLQAKK